MKNRLLERIGSNAPEEFLSSLEVVDLPLGRVLYEAEEKIRFVYFPHNAVVSLLAVLSDGSTAEMETIGREGVLGVVEALGDRVSQGRCIVQFPGSASRVKIEQFRRVVGSNASVRQTMLCYMQFLFMQILQVGVCNAIHSAESRFCRTLLIMRDRMNRDDLPLTHEFLAGMLGVHRPAVSIIAHHLQDEGLIKQGRGLITITDSNHLEDKACECYKSIRRSYDRLLPP